MEAAAAADLRFSAAGAGFPFQAHGSAAGAAELKEKCHCGQHTKKSPRRCDKISTELNLARHPPALGGATGTGGGALRERSWSAFTASMPPFWSMKSYRNLAISLSCCSCCAEMPTCSNSDLSAGSNWSIWQMKCSNVKFRYVSVELNASADQ